MIRRIVRGTLRVAVLACLAAAAADLKTSGTGGPRPRVYVVDVSGSVRVRSADAVTIEDARRFVQWDIDRSRPDDPSAVIQAGARPVIALPLQPRPTSVPEPRADPLGSDLDAALEAAIAAAGAGDIVLLSDGRGPCERSLAVASARSIAIHTMGLGPSTPRDVRIDAVDLPAGIAPGAAYAARIRLVATAPLKGILDVGGQKRPFAFEGAGAQDFTVDGLRWKVAARLEVDDDCPENNEASFSALERSEASRTLLLSAAPLAVAGDLGWHDPASYDVIVLNNIPLSGDQQQKIAAAVRSGAGLVILGGSNSYAMGGWAGTPLEELSPLWAFPDDRSAVVVAMDCSGSMNAKLPDGVTRRIDAAVSALTQALRLVRDDDELAAIAFSGEATPVGPLEAGSTRGTIAESLRRQVPGGPTCLEPALSKAIRLFKGAKASKRRIILLTDGETDEADDLLVNAGKRLRDLQVGLFIVATAGETPKLALLGGTIIAAADPSRLSAAAGEAFARSRELTLQPVSVDAGWPKPDRINRVTAKPASELLARAGEAPLAAAAPAGRGQAVALTFSLESGWAGEAARWTGLANLIARVAPRSAPQWSATAATEGDEAVIVMTRSGSSDLPDLVALLVDDRPVTAPRRGARRFEVRIPVDAGAHVVRHEGRVVADFVHPTAAEYRSLGIDGAALKRIAAMTGGREIHRVEDLPPRPEARRPASLRPALLGAAIALFFLELAISTFWRPV